jgi:hypothetical protein
MYVIIGSHFVPLEGKKKPGLSNQANIKSIQIGKISLIEYRINQL